LNFAKVTSNGPVPTGPPLESAKSPSHGAHIVLRGRSTEVVNSIASTEAARSTVERGDQEGLKHFAPTMVAPCLFFAF
jgi:hypothetical protein